MQQTIVTTRRDWVRWIAFATIAAALLVLLAGPLHRLGVGWQAALTLLRYAAFAAGIGALACILVAFVARRWADRRPFILALIGAFAGLLAFAVPMLMFMKAQSVPAIHDITTDTLDPPPFVAILPFRAGAANPPEYDGPTVAARQTAAYPTIRTLVLDTPPDQAYSRALAAAAGLGWEIVAAVPAQGRIEATDTSPWFGFKDDVVIRIRPQGTASRVDIRSKSRVGMSDSGSNAARIDSFLNRVRSTTGG